MHQETKRIVENAKIAVLMIHGIVGTPDHFRKLIPLETAVPENVSVWNLCLPGHGGSVRDFGRSSMARWRSYVRNAFLELAESHEKVILVGHSMGTLFALQLAAEYPDRVAGLFLLAVPLRPKLGMRIICSSLRLVSDRIREDHPWEQSIRLACGSRPTKRVWQYIGWLPRVVELFGEIHATESLLKELAVPYRIFQSGRDELVSGRSSHVLEKHGMQYTVLPDSGHFYYAPEDKKRILESFRI